MDLQQLCGCDRLTAVLLNKHPQFLTGVDAPFIRARFYQGCLGVLIFTEEDGFTENL